MLTQVFGKGVENCRLTLGWPWFRYPLCLGSGIDFCNALIEPAAVCGHGAVCLRSEEKKNLNVTCLFISRPEMKRFTFQILKKHVISQDELICWSLTLRLGHNIALYIAPCLMCVSVIKCVEAEVMTARNNLHMTQHRQRLLHTARRRLRSPQTHQELMTLAAAAQLDRIKKGKMLDLLKHVINYLITQKIFLNGAFIVCFFFDGRFCRDRVSGTQRQKI